MRTPEHRNSLLTKATTNSSKFIPLYLKNPAAAKGKAQIIQSHDTVSLSNFLLNPKYTPTATTSAATEHTSCLVDKPINKLS